jgi:hypothetical protein
VWKIREYLSKVWLLLDDNAVTHIAVYGKITIGRVQIFGNNFNESKFYSGRS